jgi:hypothetical protein
VTLGCNLAARPRVDDGRQAAYPEAAMPSSPVIDKFLPAIETATIPGCDAWDASATLDATVPNWRLHATGPDAAQPDSGPPLDALHRLLAAGWRELGRNGEIAAAAATQLSPAALARSHGTAHQRVRELVDRGQADGSFRTDLPAGWLVTSCFALIHACADEVRAGRIEPESALDVLTATIRDLVTP